MKNSIKNVAVIGTGVIGAGWIIRCLAHNKKVVAFDKDLKLKKRLVAGAMVFSYGLGLVATNCVNSFSYGYDKLRFIKPVFIGDTIYTIRTNMNKRPKYLKMGLVRTSYEVYKDEGELVLYCEHLHSVTYKNPQDFKDKAEVKK